MEEILLKIFKSKHNQGDSYYCYQSKKKNWIVGYKNDYPVQHGDGVEWVIPEEVAEILVSQVESLIVPKPTHWLKLKLTEMLVQLESRVDRHYSGSWIVNDEALQEYKDGISYIKQLLSA